QGRRTRSFAVVPQRNGTLTIRAITLNWWNIEHGRAEQASLPARTLRVIGTAAATAKSTPAPPSANIATSRNVTPPAASGTTHVAGVTQFWRVATLASFALWLLAAVAFGTWWLRRRAAEESHGVAAPGGESLPAASPAAPPPGEGGTTPAAPNARALQRRALDAAGSGDPAACERALLDWARATHPHISHIHALRDALSDARQRNALDALQRARWQGGDSSPAGAAVAEAFAR